MKTWNITSRSTGLDFGDYEGETAKDAADSMALDCGYQSVDAAEEVIGHDWYEDLRIVEVVR